VALLDSAARADATRKFVEAFFVGLARVADLDSDEVRTLVNDLDAWLDANQTAANNAITTSVRNKASTTTKFAALAYVALKRGNVI
jgi:hypothetical protein